MKQDRFNRLITFLRDLEKANIPFQLARYLDHAISVEVAVPGEHWEVDFHEDGHKEVERYRSKGIMDDESALTDPFAMFSDEELAATHDATART
jgi:hypothetical protein